MSAKNLPVPVDENKDIEVYEFKGGFCMTTELLGMRLGYKNPKEGMGQLFKRYKTILEPHRFVDTVSTNPQGGRPSFIYDEGGILKCCLLSETDDAKDFGPRLVDRLERMRDQQRAQKDAQIIQLQAQNLVIFEELRKKRKATGITKEEKEEMRAMYLTGTTERDLWRKYDLSWSTVRGILKQAGIKIRREPKKA